MNLFTIFLVIFMATTLATSDPIPSSFQACHQNDHNLNGCIEKALKNLQNYLTSGNLGNGIRFTPFNVINMEEDIRYDYEDIVVKVTNIKIFGADKFTIEQIKASTNPFTVEAIFRYNDLSTSSDYQINAPNQNFHGSGKIEQKINLLRQKFSFVFDKTSDDKMRVASLKVEILEAQTGKTTFTPNGNSDKVFMELVAEYVDENGDNIIMEIKPVSERSSEKFYTSIANEILSHFSYDEILPL